MPNRLVTIIRAVDDAIIDNAFQPLVNRADWYFGLSAYDAAKISIIIGGFIGLIWVHNFFVFPSADFYQAIICLAIMAGSTYLVTTLHENHAPKRPNLAPAARLTDLGLRTFWLLYPLLFLTQIPVEPHNELALNFIWTAFVVLPYWLICCRAAPPPRRRHSFQPVPITVR
jgi:hypothetical protein